MEKVEKNAYAPEMLKYIKLLYIKLLSCTVEKVEKNAYAPKILKYNFPYNSHLLTYEDTSYQEWKALFGMHFVSYSEILEALNHALLSI